MGVIIFGFRVAVAAGCAAKGACGSPVAVGLLRDGALLHLLQPHQRRLRQRVGQHAARKGFQRLHHAHRRSVG